MRAFVVVEVYYVVQLALAVLKVSKFHMIEPFRLEYAIGTLGYGVLKRVSALCHAYPHAMACQQLYIRARAVLGAAVGVVDELRLAVPRHICQSHLESVYRIDCFKCLPQRPAHNLSGVGIGDERQVAHTGACLNVGYVADPDHVWAHDLHALYEIRVLLIGVLRVCGLVVPPLFVFHHQVVVSEYLDEGIPTREAARLLKAPTHKVVELVRTKPGASAPVLPDALNNERLERGIPVVRLIAALVIRLPAMTKQPAKLVDGRPIARLA